MSRAAVPGPSGFRGKVLVAEDNSVSQRLAEILLTGLGLDVTVVADGQRALEEFQRVAYDLILMDGQMPVLDGLEATRRIRALERGRRVPIVAVTASALEEEVQRFSEAGMDDFLAKPFNPEDLLQVLAAWLPRRE